jgi:superfamily II DNA/RNA helicase
MGSYIHRIGRDGGFGVYNITALLKTLHQIS